MINLSSVSVWSAAITSGLSLAGALLAILWHSRRPGASQTAALYLGASAVCNAVWALQQAGKLPALERSSFADLTGASLLILSVCFLLMTRWMMGYRVRAWKWIGLGLAWLILVIVISSLVSWFLQIDASLTEGGFSWLQSGARVWLALGWAGFMSLAAYFTLKTYRQTSRYSQEAPYWIGVILLTGSGNAAWWGRYDWLSGLFQILSVISILAVVSQPRLPVLPETSQRLVSRLFFTVLAMVRYTVGFALAITLARAWTGGSPLFIGLAFAALLTLLLNPVLARAQHQFQQRAASPKDETAALLRQYSQSITNTLDLNLLATVAVGTASEYLEIRSGYLYLVDLAKKEGNLSEYALRGVKGMGSLDPKSGRFCRESPLAEAFRTASQPVTHNQLLALPRAREIAAEERHWLDSLAAHVYVPIHSQDQWIGLIVLGPKDSGAEYTAQDLTFLSTMAGQTAVALENARLVEGLVQANNEARRAYQALDQANRHLESLDKAKSDFLSIVSHELRTPMNLISGASHMLLDESDLQNNLYYKEVLENLRRGTLRLEKIIESMLDMARIDTRLMVLELQPVAIHSVVRLVHDDLAMDASARKQRVEIRDLDKLPVVMGDLAALRKAFYNLVINAIKYTPDGGKISIWGRIIPQNEKDCPAGAIEIVISDTGIGIDPGYRDLVFAKFYQTSESAFHSSGETKFKGGGPGLGLAIARGIVEAHQGKIWVESPGFDEQRCPGSHFHVILPLRLTAKPELHPD